MMELHKLKAFKPQIKADFKRADIEIYGIDHFRPSYTGLIFFNCDEKDPKKLINEHPDCAARFSVFGHDECTGDEGHCSMKTPDRFDTRRSHPLTKAFKRVEVTKPLKAAIKKRKTLEITIIVADEAGIEKKKKKKKKSSGETVQLFDCVGIQLVTFA